MYHGQFFGKIVHEIMPLSIKYGQSRNREKIHFVHGQLSTKRTRPHFLMNHSINIHVIV